MKKFIGFTKIGQYRQVVRDIMHIAQYQGMDENGEHIMNRGADLPTIPFKGTVKLHGTNAGVAMDGDGEMWYQSRKGIITPTKDNAGFAFFADSNKAIFENFINDIRVNALLTDETVVIFGEWCGGNIQKGVAINGLDKMFVIFAVKVVPIDDEKPNYYIHENNWDNCKAPDNRIYNINDFEHKTIDIDFNNPELSRNVMIDIMSEVEKECPVGKAFGRKLDEDDTTGEGNVWVGWYNNVRHIFKVKGEKHSVSKVKVLAPVDIEKINSVNSFVEYVVTANRLEQGIEQVFTSESKTPDMASTGTYLKWVLNDIMSEEMDTLIGNNLEPKDVNKSVMVASRKWYFNYIESM